MDKIQNVKTLPKVYYGLHMAPGVAEYREEGKEPYRIFIGEEAIKNMDPSFSGRPVFVQHVDDVNLENLQNEADGYVIESFYNKYDGKHWVKFLIVSDRGHNSIKTGWVLSNSYFIKNEAPGGLCHGVEYLKEVKAGEYDHLAIVPNPRYEESIILTPEQFKSYNEEKEFELKKVANSNKGAKQMLQFFKKSKVENSDLENTLVTLPKTKKEVTISQLVNEMDDMYKKDEGKDPKAPAMANGDHHVMVGEDKMSVNDLVKKHVEMCNELADLKKKKEGGAEEGMDEKSENEEGMDMGEEHAEKDKKASDKTENEEGLDVGEEKAEKDKKASDKTEKKSNAADLEKIANARKKAEALKNAQSNARVKDPVQADFDKLARGKTRYGSN